MKSEQVVAIEQCARLSHAGKIQFPEVIVRLAAVGVERYHSDYSRQEITYYLTDGSSHVVSSPHPEHPTALEFSAAAVESAVRQSQRNEHTYADFVRKTTAAGCVGYFVQITGRRVLYFGRNGEVHTEEFPPGPRE